jgi:hypothetical protein
MTNNNINEIDYDLNSFCEAMGMVEETAQEDDWLEVLTECCQEEIDYDFLG